MGKVDIPYCASSFLMYRTIVDKNKCFSNNFPLNYSSIPENRIKVKNSNDLYNALKSQIDDLIKSGKKIALALSGGIDSAVLARMMPKDSIAYTFKCVVPGVEVTDETPRARKYADENGLVHKIIEVYWEDFEKYSTDLMKHKGAPMHSIEVQIYKCALQAKKDGIDVLIFGESADLLYGGLSGLLSKDWNLGEFVERYSYVLPYKVLKEYEMDLLPYTDSLDENDMVDVPKFCNTYFIREALGSYYNACETAGVVLYLPYSHTVLDEKLDLDLVRAGQNKYIIRKVFEDLYPDFVAPDKIPMPRPMNEWFKNWSGPKRSEFWKNCVNGMDGDQRWLIWSLEKFLDIIEEE